ncbi:MAG: 30S ribosomal protein S1 [Holosporaceae bacterium]|jgi:small subunit ribosomal protein S1|nr:30S ribosomal protein S1 [Holosporaceae bacterium]
MTSGSDSRDENFSELFELVCSEKICAEKVVKGIVVSVDDNFITLDVGLKSEGRVPVGEFEHGGKKIELKQGDKVDIFIERYEDKSGEIVLSREKALRAAAWDDFGKAYRDGTPVKGTVYSRVKGGFMVDLGGATAFLPASQVDVRPIKDITALLGVEQPFLILKMDKARENIVVSRRGILEGANAEDRARLVSNLQEGQKVEGIVKNITSYGAFIDIGGVDGLLHNVDISWQRVNHPAEVLAVGQKVTVIVVKCNIEAKRISLGLKQLTPDPWSGVVEEFKVGTHADGVVTNVTDYGIFVEVKKGVEGLVHISEMSWKKNMHPSKVTAVGAALKVMILDVDMVKRRMGLGIKQLQPNPWNDLVKNFPVGHVFDGVITSVTDFGLFVNMYDEIDGMVHINDVPESENDRKRLEQYHKGDTVKVKVLEIDPLKERIALGIKQLDVTQGRPSCNIKKGTVVTGVISAIDNDGIEVTIADGISGTIRKTDLAKDRHDRRTERFAVGEKVDAKVIAIDKNGRRVGLSIKALEIDEEEQVMAEYGSSDSGASLGDILGMAIGRHDKN